jgi:hypothetical protein
MALPITRTHAHLNAYHQTDSLLLQFILSEFIASYREILMIHQLSKETTENPTLVTKNVSQCIEKLSGSSKISMKMYSWNLEEGILSKLKNYCEHFSLNNKDYHDLHHFAHQAWLNCLQSFEILKCNCISSKNLQKVLNRIASLMRRFARIALRLIQKYREDENILFFVLRNHEQLDAIYGSQFVFKLFSRLFPRGLSGALEFLQQRYSARGFENLKKIINNKIAELELVNA